jgi:uncharacterized protein YecT (DUF1311 family)
MNARIKLFALFACLLIWMVPGARAQAGSPAKSGCENPQSQMEMNQCAASSYKAADAELNSLYAALQGKPADAVTQKLQIAQRAWIKYRDANCEAEAELYAGGSIQPMILAACMERVTRARIAELHAIYDTH